MAMGHAMERILLAAMLVAAVAARAHPERRIHPKFAAALEKHTCDNAHENERTNILMESSCGKPKEVFVELKAEGSHIQILPGAVWVKRCVGLCADPGKQCTAVKKRERQVPVRYLDVSTGKESCAMYAVEEHLQCGCRCPLSATDCQAGQHFNHRKCKCECTNLEERRKCLAKRLDGRHLNLKWNRSKCACEQRHK